MQLKEIRTEAERTFFFPHKKNLHCVKLSVTAAKNDHQ